MSRELFVNGAHITLKKEKQYFAESLLINDTTADVVEEELSTPTFLHKIEVGESLHAIEFGV